jgi:chemotaxis protein CheX
MNIKYLLPFVDAAYEVLKAEIRTDLKRGELALDKGHYHTDDLTVILSLVGDLEGTVFYSMSSLTGMKIASAIMGEEFTEFNQLAQSGVAELGNVITGRATVKMSQAGFETNISPPTMIMGKGATISTIDLPRLIIPLSGDVGTITIHLAIRDAGNKGVSVADQAVPEAPKI